jgi:hypothetical protein
VPFPPPESFEDRRPYLEVRFVKLGQSWTALFDGKEVGCVNHDSVARAHEVQVWSGPGPARIDSVILDKIELDQ